MTAIDDPKPDAEASASAEAAPERRSRSTLDHSDAETGDRGTSPARFLIVLAIAFVLVLSATNLLGVWSLPGQSEARREAQRKAVELKEEARKATEREVVARQKAAEERERAAEEARRRARETARVPPPMPPAPTVTLPNRPELPARPPPPPAVPTPEPSTKPFNPREVMEQARRTIDETFGKEPAAPSLPSPTAPSPSATPAPDRPAARPPSQQDLIDEIRRKLDRLSGKGKETETAARQPPSATPNETARPPVSRPDLSSTSCRVNRPYLAAIAACDDIIKRHPDAAEAYFVRGWARNQGREYGRAITDLSRSIELDPADWRAYAQRGYALHSIRAFERAIEDYSRAIEMRPSDASLYNNRGLSRMLNKDHTGARADLDKSIALNSRYALALFNRARLNQADGGQNERALEDATRAIEINPRFAPALSLRADLHAALGNHRAAIQDLDQLIALEARNQSAYVRRARSRIETRAFDEAKSDADRALEIFPRSVDAIVERGRAWEGKGDPQAAIRDYRAALEIQPAHEAARSHLKRLGEE